jgi:hypothetical protein
VMELVDVPDSKSGAARRGGSSPPRGTIPPLFIFKLRPNRYTDLLCYDYCHKKLLASAK